MRFLFQWISPRIKLLPKKNLTALPQQHLEGPRNLESLQTLLNMGSDLFTHYIETGIDVPSSRALYEASNIAHRRFEEDQDISHYGEVLKQIKERQLLSTYLESHAYLRLKENWDTLKNQSILQSLQDIQQVGDLQKKWMRHAAFSHFTPHTLLNTSILCNRLLKIIAQAKKEALYYKNKKNTNTIDSYVSYLSSYQKIIEEQKTTLSEAIYARINTAITTKNLHTSDPLPGLLSNLQGLNLPLFPQYESLEMKLPFVKYCYYIATRGSLELKKLTADKLKITYGEKDMPLILLSQKNRAALVPQLFINDIPRKPAFFPFLFRGHQARYDFFIQRESFLFNLVANKSILSRPDWELGQGEWKKLATLQSQITRELSLVSRKNKFFNTWKNFLLQKKKDILQMQMQYLRTLSRTPPLLCPLSSGDSIKDLCTKMENTLQCCEADILLVKDKTLAADWKPIREAILLALLPVRLKKSLQQAIICWLSDQVLPAASFHALIADLRTPYQGYPASQILEKAAIKQNSESLLLQNIQDITGYLQGNTHNLPSLEKIEQIIGVLEVIQARSEIEINNLREEILKAAIALKSCSEIALKVDLEAVDSPIQRISLLLEKIAGIYPQWEEVHTILKVNKDFQWCILKGITPGTVNDKLTSISGNMAALEEMVNYFTNKASQRDQFFLAVLPLTQSPSEVPYATKTS